MFGKTRDRGRNPHIHYRCSFCGRSQEQVQRLIAGPGGVYICNECIGLCQQIIGEETAPTQQPSSVAAETPFTCGLCGQPLGVGAQWGIAYSPPGSDDDWDLMHRVHGECLRRALPVDLAHRVMAQGDDPDPDSRN